MKIIFIIILVSLGQSSYGQRPLEILENAYSDFSYSKYQKAGHKFDEYFEIFKGSKEDHYIAAVCAAQQKDKKRALFYAEKFASDISDVFMMLADSNLAIIHGSLEEIKEELEIFYGFFKEASYTPTEQIDSIYQQLKWKKLFLDDYIRIVNKQKTQRDTAIAFRYIDEILNQKHYSSKDETSRIVYLLERRQFPKQFDENFPYIDDLYDPTLSMFNLDGKDVLEKALFAEKVVNSIGEFGLLEIHFFKLAEIFAKAGEYEKTTEYLLIALEKGFHNLNRLFTEKSFKPYFRSIEGTLLLKYLFSEFFDQEISKCDTIIIGSEVGFTRSSHHKQRDLISNSPSLEEIYGFLVIASKDNSNNLNYIPYYSYENINSILAINRSLDVDVNYIKKGVFTLRPSSKKEYLYLIKSPLHTQEEIVYRAGKNYKLSLGNLMFVEKIKNGQIPLSKIPKIRRNYFRNLSKEKALPLFKYADRLEVNRTKLEHNLNPALEDYVRQTFQDISYPEGRQMVDIILQNSVNPSLIPKSISLLQDTLVLDLSDQKEVQSLQRINSYLGKLSENYGLNPENQEFISLYKKDPVLTKLQVAQRASYFKNLFERLKSGNTINSKLLVKGHAPFVETHYKGYSFSYNQYSQLPSISRSPYIEENLFYDGRNVTLEKFKFTKGIALDSTIFINILGAGTKAIPNASNEDLLNINKFVEENLTIDTTGKVNYIPYNNPLRNHIQAFKIQDQLIFLSDLRDSLYVTVSNGLLDKKSFNDPYKNHDRINPVRRIAYKHSVSFDTLTMVGQFQYCTDSLCNEKTTKVFLEDFDYNLNLIHKKQLTTNLEEQFKNSQFTLLKIIQTAEFNYLLFQNDSKSEVKIQIEIYDKSWKRVNNSANHIIENKAFGDILFHFIHEEKVFLFCGIDKNNEKKLALKILDEKKSSQLLPVIRYFGQLRDIDVKITNENTMRVGYIEELLGNPDIFFKEFDLDLKHLTLPIK